MSKTSVWAAIILVTAHIFYSHPKAFADKKDVDPSLEGTISSAQQRLLQKDRQGALALLRSQARKLKESNKADRLRNEGQRLAEVFLTDKGQRIYELSFALLRENKAQALDKLKEAMELEDGQAQIQMLMIRLELFMDQCKRAEALLEKFMHMEWIYPEDVLELKISIAACSGEARGLSGLAQKPQFRKMALAPYAMGLLEVESGEPSAAMRRFLEMTTKDPKFPTPWYWLWKLEKESSLKVKYGMKYQSLCEGEDLPLGRYKNFPARCKYLPEVEEYILKERTDVSHEKAD